MKLSILQIEDDTPKGLTTGFRLRLRCQLEDGRSFVLNTAVLVSKDVFAKSVPLPNIVVGYLKRSGVGDYTNELFVDSRRLDLDPLCGPEPELPMTIDLGGDERVNRMILDKAAKG